MARMSEEPNSSTSAIHIASRLFSAYLLFWAADDLILLLRYLLGFMHYQRQQTAEGLYLVRSYGLDVASDVFRIALLLMAACWFYRCGPRVQRFFSEK